VPAGGEAAGELVLALHGRVAELARRLGGVRPHLALSRTRSHAFAVVLLESPTS
jgi:hypothetical protein